MRVHERAEGLAPAARREVLGLELVVVRRGPARLPHRRAHHLGGDDRGVLRFSDCDRGDGTADAETLVELLDSILTRGQRRGVGGGGRVGSARGGVGP